MCNYKPVTAKNLPKTLCKNSPKNPQKPHKNLVGQKLLYIFKH